MKSKKQYRRKLVNALDRNHNDDREYAANVDGVIRIKSDENGKRGYLFRLFGILLLLTLLATTDFKQWKPIKWGQSSFQFVQSLLIQNKSQKKIENRRIVLLTPEMSNLYDLSLSKKDKKKDFANYLKDISEAGYSHQFKMFQIHAFYNAGIPISYLNEMRQSGYLNNYPFPELIAFYKSGINANYLNSLKDSGLLTRLSFIDIIRSKKELQYKG